MAVSRFVCTHLSIISLMSLLAGCISSSPMKFTVASTNSPSNGYTLLQEGVIGQDCEGQYGSYEVATRIAISSVDEANALINVEFSRREMPIARICVTVTGDAVKI
jgi:hypothetical protein